MACQKTLSAGKNHVLSVFIAVVVALIPKCPLCWSAYASLLSTLGIASFPYYDWILPVMIAFLFINLFALGFIAKRKRLYGPFALSLAGAMIIVGGKFWLGNNACCYLGVSLIIASSLWNMLARKSACASA